MFLRSLKLSNIRSYQEETIHFSPGSTLLSGDIGSGKSSLLLAIEFALFGTSRPDLPAEALLRKGTTQGYAELGFTLGQEEITIRRSLKKDSQGIKQTPGFIIINHTKKELMPIELKAEILRLLGYPEEMLTKNKNDVFRYTVYTPQEEMKAIIGENPDIRLDSLHKIFNIDKYKNIRENVQYYLKQLRVQMAIAAAALGPLEQQQQQLILLQQEEQDCQKTLQQIEPKLQGLQESMQKAQQALQELEQRQEQRQRLLQEADRLQTLIQERESQRKDAAMMEIGLKDKLAVFPAAGECSRSDMEKNIIALDTQRTTLINQRGSFQQQLQSLQERMADIQQRQQKIQEQCRAIPDKERLLQRLQQELEPLRTLEQKKEQLQELLERTVSLITKNQTLLEQAHLIAETISTLDVCPTCQQRVPEEHKLTIHQREEETIGRAEHLLFELRKKQSSIREQLQQLQQQLLFRMERSNLLNRTELELSHLQRQQEEQNQLGLQVQDIQEHQAKTKELLAQFDQAALLQVEEQLTTARTLLQQLQQQEYLQKQLHYYQEQGRLLEEQSIHLRTKLGELEQQLSQSQDGGQQLQSQKAVLLQLLQEEKEVSIQQAKAQQQLLGIHVQKNQLEQTIKQLLETKGKLLRLQEIHHWLEEYFFPLTLLIEKHIMLHIHRLFSQLFQEWFGILIDNEQMTAMIDDAFSPVIIQDGYEILFDNLSGGEKTSAALAYRLALNKVINEIIQDIKTKDLLILDEPTDGFSSEQLDKVREVLERLGIEQTILVSHEAKVESFVEHIIHIEKKGQESKVRVAGE